MNVQNLLFALLIASLSVVGVLFTSVNAYQYSFFFTDIHIWKHLPEEIITSKLYLIELFQARIRAVKSERTGPRNDLDQTAQTIYMY